MWIVYYVTPKINWKGVSGAVTFMQWNCVRSIPHWLVRFQKNINVCTNRSQDGTDYSQSSCSTMSSWALVVPEGPSGKLHWPNSLTPETWAHSWLLHSLRTSRVASAKFSTMWWSISGSIMIHYATVMWDISCIRLYLLSCGLSELWTHRWGMSWSTFEGATLCSRPGDRKPLQTQSSNQQKQEWLQRKTSWCFGFATQWIKRTLDVMVSIGRIMIRFVVPVFQKVRGTLDFICQKFFFLKFFQMVGCQTLSTSARRQDLTSF